MAQGHISLSKSGGGAKRVDAGDGHAAGGAQGATLTLSRSLARESTSSISPGDSPGPGHRAPRVARLRLLCLCLLR
jgi:hypothetical protein